MPKVEVSQVNRLSGAPNLSGKVAFRVYYSVIRKTDEGCDEEWMGYTRLVTDQIFTAVDELDLYREFPKEMQERHNITPNNVRWLMNQGDKNEGVC
jgi:hypothetical protein